MLYRRPRLLCYGHDEMLQFTRKRILEREHEVETCDELARLPEILAEGPLQVVVLCQSVPDWECDEVMELSRAAWPAVKVLVLHEAPAGQCSAHSDCTMDNLEGPPALLHEIQALMKAASVENPAAPVARSRNSMRMESL
jgi:hypothetical protein